MAKFAVNYTYRTPLRTVEFRAGQETVDAAIIAVAESAGALVKDMPDASNGPAKGGKTGRPINLKG